MTSCDDIVNCNVLIIIIKKMNISCFVISWMEFWKMSSVHKLFHFVFSPVLNGAITNINTQDIDFLP